MNLEQEIRKGYCISSEMKKVWAVEMKLLNKLLEVCKKHNLKIWAEGGTLLGAIREHGFIPWDDDIDMVMPREDYDKLQAIAKDEFMAPYFFQSGLFEEFPCGFSKLRMDGTAAINPYEIWQNYHQGIFIDIFCLDAVPDSKEEIIYQKKMSEKLLKEMKFYCMHFFSFTNFRYNYNILSVKLKYKLKGFHTCFKKYDDLFKKYNIDDNRYVALSSFYYNLDKYKREKTWYNDTLFVPFEDILMPVPICYDDILSLQYGDYMKPIQLPTGHGYFEILDSSRSYKDYLPVLRKKHKWDKWNIRIKMIKEKLKFKK